MPARKSKPQATEGKKPPAKKPKLHKLAAVIPAGEVLQDIHKRKWKLGNPIGKGGFGVIYLADQATDKAVTNDASYVVKIEPGENGPLFCEVHFYMRAAKPETLQSWIEKKNMSYVGVPEYVGWGKHQHEQLDQRFLVMPRFGTDLHVLFTQNGKHLSEEHTYVVGLRMLEALEYIHDQGYVHADIKGSNIFTGCGPTMQGQVYLADYGLASRYVTSTGAHRPYKADPRAAHNGTIEYTSIDAHHGAEPSRRGDLEILGYCMVHWLCGLLPWENKLTDCTYVRDQKMKYMNNISLFMKTCFPSGKKHQALSDYLTYVSEMEYEETPDYEKLKKLLCNRLKAIGCKDNGKVVFDTQGSGRTKAKKRSFMNGSSDISSDMSPPKKMKSSPKKMKSPPKKIKSSPKKMKSPSKKIKSSPKKMKSPPKKIKSSPKKKTPRKAAAKPKTKSAKTASDSTGKALVIPAEAFISPKSSTASLAKSPRSTKEPLSKLKSRTTRKASASAAVPSPRVKLIKKSVAVSTQTSPGLKGLKKRRKSVVV